MAGFNPNKFIKGGEECKDYALDKVPDTKAVTKKKSSSKKKSKDAVPADSVDTSLNFTQSNVPYMEAYKDTNDQLDDAINQLDVLGRELVGELVTIKSSKTLKNKYNYINDMTSTISTLISTKIGAVKEKNKTINDTNNLELKRIKELKINDSEVDDNQKIMNMYDAFINTPIGSYPNIGANALGPSLSDMTIAGSREFDTVQVAQGGNDAAWGAGLNPAENRMLLDAQGKIETVVMYDGATGNRWYEVVDKDTKQPMLNVEKPSNDNIYDLDINVRGGYAKDANRNVTYQLIVMNNGDPSILEY